MITAAGKRSGSLFFESQHLEWQAVVAVTVARACGVGTIVAANNRACAVVGLTYPPTAMTRRE